MFGGQWFIERKPPPVDVVHMRTIFDKITKKVAYFALESFPLRVTIALEIDIINRCISNPNNNVFMIHSRSPI